MVITYHGENYFKIQSGDLVVLVDPLNQRSFKGAALVLLTQKTDNDFEVENEPLILSHQGEYEIKGIHVNGWTQNQNTIYRLEMDDLILGVLGHPSHEPDSETQEYLQEIDVLFVPAGGKPYLNPAAMAKLIRQLEPALIIPSLYQNLKPFLKEMGQDKCETEEKLTLKKRDLKPGAMAVRCLRA